MANSTKKTDDKRHIHIPNVRKTGDLTDLQRRLWQTIEMCWTVIRSDETSLEEKRQFGHLMSQTAGNYSKLCETLNLADELDKLKAEITELKQTEGMRKVA
ncbi:MAG: hypothetical protein WD021_11075 [Rhodothermales bacterium]